MLYAFHLVLAFIVSWGSDTWAPAIPEDAACVLVDGPRILVNGTDLPVQWLTCPDEGETLYGATGE